MDPKKAADFHNRKENIHLAASSYMHASRRTKNIIYGLLMITGVSVAEILFRNNWLVGWLIGWLVWLPYLREWVDQGAMSQGVEE